MPSTAIHRSRLLSRLTLLLLVASPASQAVGAVEGPVPRYTPILLQSRSIRVRSTAMTVGD